MDVIEVSMGRMALGSAPTVLTTGGIGSCIAVCLYSRSKQIGCLAHVMLSHHPNLTAQMTQDDLKYADVAIPAMVEELTKNGIPSSQLIAKIAGGANMFPGIAGRSEKPGEKNIAAVKELLTKLNIPLAAESTGGTNGRSLEFDLANGIVSIQVTI